MYNVARKVVIKMRIGAHYLGNRKCEFTVWAPLLKELSLKLAAPLEQKFAMKRDEKGYWQALIDDITPGTRYCYSLEGRIQKPDPASFYQPQGVHGPSEVIDHNNFHWEDGGWKGVSLNEMIIYELHVGAFTLEGTFEAIIPRLPDLIGLGINTIEIMPVGQFSGECNWGYDGVYPFSVQNSYGGPNGLKKLVNACHKNGISVILDVIYNHLGPEGNYLAEFAPYFTDRYKTPWGMAVNFDGRYSDEVRNYFIQNALYWLNAFHIDALRLDAVHSIFDMSVKPFLKELAEKIEDFSLKQARKFYLIAESDLNDPKLILSKENHGYGIDAQWDDDFHHALHTLITGESNGYYADFGRISDLVKAFRETFVYSWNYSIFRKRHHGSSVKDEMADKFIVFSQNHDQVGNRTLGERLSVLVNFEALKLTAGAYILSPYVPLIFMGEEYSEESPFLFFVSYSDASLIKAVQRGRKEEFKAFGWQQEAPDPQAPDTFMRSKLNWEKRLEGKQGVLYGFYKELIRLRKKVPALFNLDKNKMEVSGVETDKLILLKRWHNDNQLYCIMNFNKKDISITADLGGGEWLKIIDSSDKIWMGPGSSLPEKIKNKDNLTIKALSLALYEQKI